MACPTQPLCATLSSGLGLFAVNWPADYAKALHNKVGAFFTTRLGGVSAPPWDSLNLGVHVGDIPQHVAQNRSLLRQALNEARPLEASSKPLHAVFLKQVHGTECVALDTATREAPDDSLVADAAWTQEPALACTIMVADCLPLLFATLDGEHVAAAHAGWRGLLGQGGVGVIENTLAALRRVSSSPIAVWLGPCIGAQAFEVGEEVRNAFTLPGEQAHFVLQSQAQHASATPQHSKKHLGNLPALARLRLLRAGIPEAAISGHPASFDPAWCTFTNEEQFFSHRRDSQKLGSTGRMAACVWKWGGLTG